MDLNGDRRRALRHRRVPGAGGTARGHRHRHPFDEIAGHVRAVLATLAEAVSAKEWFDVAVEPEDGGGMVPARPARTAGSRIAARLFVSALTRDDRDRTPSLQQDVLADGSWHRGHAGPGSKDNELRMRPTGRIDDRASGKSGRNAQVGMCPLLTELIIDGLPKCRLGIGPRTRDRRDPGACAAVFVAAAGSAIRTWNRCRTLTSFPQAGRSPALQRLRSRNGGGAKLTTSAMPSLLAERLMRAVWRTGHCEVM